jgi:hypothetical protein
MRLGFHPFAQFPTWGFRGFDSEVIVSQRSWLRCCYWALSALIKLYITVYIDKSRFCWIDRATRLWVERPEFDSQREQNFSLLNNVKIGRSVMRPTRPLIKWLQGTVSSGVKRQWREANNSPPSSVDVKSGGATLPLPITYSWPDA